MKFQENKIIKYYMLFKNQRSKSVKKWRIYKEILKELQIILID